MSPVKLHKRLLLSALLLSALSACSSNPVLTAPEKGAQHIRKSFMVTGGPGSPEAENERLAAKYRGTYYLEGLRHTKRIAFSFDDGPSSYTRDLLKVLHKHDVKATFFWMGRRIEEYPEIARAAYDAGHTIGNHSFSHADLTRLPPEQVWDDEIGKTQAVIERVLGIRPVLVRPPFGYLRDAQVELLAARGIKAILWSIDTKDWYLARMPDVAADRIEQTVLAVIHDEAIVLMHDDGGPRDKTVEAVDRLIPQLKARGYQFVTVDALIHVKPYQ
jgi:peptidoglycan-N-acetylglucosamine deacetylase